AHNLKAAGSNPAPATKNTKMPPHKGGFLRLDRTARRLNPSSGARNEAKPTQRDRNLNSCDRNQTKS
ncbi:hypothetical protein, partial [Ensifer sp.]|uniref:hypothetical protein n=1 Tax=Ensifer sp. TaxID=1872086 RepID=UPI002898AC6A